MDKKPQNLIGRFLYWVIGNTIWDVIRSVIALVFTLLQTGKIFSQQIREGLDNVNILTAINIVLVFFGILFLTLIILAVAQTFIQKLIGAKNSEDAEANIEISNSPATNRNQIVLTIKNNYNVELMNCHGKITKIEYREFGKPEQKLKPLPTTNQKLEWHSVDSKDGFVTIRANGGSEDISLAWAKDTDNLWGQPEIYGLSYMLKKPQGLKEGIYFVAFQMEGDIKRMLKTETVKVKKTACVGFQKEQYVASFDGFSTRPTVQLVEVKDEKENQKTT